MVSFSTALRNAAVFLTLASAAAASLQIIPGGTWTAANTGLAIQAHGGSIIQEGSTYYWIGEDKTNGNEYTAVNCFSSTNLVEWNFVRALLTRGSSGDLGPNRVIERPKVIYNSNTKQYVMYMHIDSASYSEAKVGLATSNSLCGSKYSYKGSWQPLGHQSRDMGLYKDTDGKAYLLSEDRENGLRIDQLTSDYLNVTSATYLFPDSIEAPAMYKKDGTYFMFGSSLTGYDSNDNMYSTASSISGPWTSFEGFAPSGSHTYNSQTTFILPVGNNIMYMGDRWDGDNLVQSTYVWLPISISGTTTSLRNYVNWLPTTFANGPSEYSYQGESASLTNGARVVSCSGCAEGDAAGYLGGPSDGAVTFNGVMSDATTRTTVRLKCKNGDSGPRYGNVTVNGQTQRLAFLPSASRSTGDVPLSASLNCNLKQGSNTIVISGFNSSYGPDVDQIFVPKT